MLTETIGGLCPACGYNKNFLRYGSEGYFNFQACPKCGFAYGHWFGFNGKEVPGTEEAANEHLTDDWHTAIWDKICEHDNRSREEMYRKLDSAEEDPEWKGLPLFNFTPEEVAEFKKLNLPVYG